jgi:hypothetical protein
MAFVLVPHLDPGHASLRTEILQRSITAQEWLTLAENIVKTIREPFTVLDANLKVITASSPFYREFRVIPEQTVGNRFTSMPTGIGYSWVTRGH